MSFPIRTGNRLFLLIALFLFASIPAKAQEQRRLALIIGNDAYENVTPLAKAVNDAEAVTARLAEIGFTVTKASDIGRRAMSRAVLEFEKTIKPGDLVLFYYAGHGFAVSGQNFLLPVDIPAAGPGEESLVRDEAFLADDLTERFQRAGAKTIVLVLDACRDNPFEQPGKRSLGGQSGLARMEPSEGVFVLFSAGIGQAALESGWGRGEIKRPDGSPAYNLFGIKAGSSWRGDTVDVTTTEYIDGRPVRQVERFRAYGSYAEAFSDWATLMRKNPRYAGVLQAADSVRDFAYGLQAAGYATDPRYGMKLENVINKAIEIREARDAG